MFAALSYVGSFRLRVPMEIYVQPVYSTDMNVSFKAHNISSLYKTVFCQICNSLTDFFFLHSESYTETIICILLPLFVYILLIK